MDFSAELAQRLENNFVEIVVLACEITFFPSTWGKLDSVRVAAVVSMAVCCARWARVIRADLGQSRTEMLAHKATQSGQGEIGAVKRYELDSISD